MIRQVDKVFLLETDHTSYVMQIADTGHVEHLYYGAKLGLGLELAGADQQLEDQIWNSSIRALTQKRSNNNGCSIAYDLEHPALSTNDMSLEVSALGTGDYRQPFLQIVWEDGSRTSDFVFEKAQIVDGKPAIEGLPSAYDQTGKAQTLILTLKEKYKPVRLELAYGVFPECDAITRSAKLYNDGAQPIEIAKIMSMQLDLDGQNFVMTSFRGDWAREMNRVDVEALSMVVNTTRTGNSSNHANPFVMLCAKGTGETSGEGYGFNLIYSGNHYEAAEASSQGKTRFVAGISPEDFGWILDPGESFQTPEAVMTYTGHGYRELSEHMHGFVREHIVRGHWKNKVRPILLNSWEASYFKFTESKLLSLAKAGKEAGIELFVMDDGWFGERNDDTSSLGDWVENRKKLPDGVKGLADKINAMGMDFGIWVEPEMVNENSNLYREHPDWAVRIPDRNHGLGRNQMILDLTRTEVQDYLIESMTKVFSLGNIAYVKWDMNRNFSDVYSLALPKERQAEFIHRYMLGLYRVMDTLCKAFPQILFEGCASGGNRFDLGMLCYMPQIWGSDDTDAICRAYIQNGYSYGYPQTVFGAHVSECPNHQTLRETPLETRFAVASFGVLGYECNLGEMHKEDLQEIKVQIEIYKKWRETLFFGQWYRIGGSLVGDMAQVDKTPNRNLIEWQIVSPDKSKSVAMMVQETVKPHTSHLKLRLTGLDDKKLYHVTGRTIKLDIKKFGGLVNMIAPIHIKQDSLMHNAIAKFVKLDGETEDYTLSGSLLNRAGLELAQSFAGTGLGENTRVYQDFDSRMYFLEEVKA
ncbi:MAG: alpha-galactosidase [Lachnospiraceae bacterium]|nr:alpha-galactosidase [Lachnospiraceae bacterium]